MIGAVISEWTRFRAHTRRIKLTNSLWRDECSAHVQNQRTLYIEIEIGSGKRAQITDRVDITIKLPEHKIQIIPLCFFLRLSLALTRSDAPQPNAERKHGDEEEVEEEEENAST